MSDVVLFPGTKLEPDVCLHQVLETAGDIKNIVILRVNKSGTCDVITSRITMDTLCFALVHLQSYVQQVLTGDPPERTTLTPPKEPA